MHLININGNSDIRVYCWLINCTIFIDIDISFETGWLSILYSFGIKFKLDDLPIKFLTRMKKIRCMNNGFINFFKIK